MPHILHKTLVIRLSSVGDIVLTSLAVRALRNRFPDSQIDFLVKEEYADLVRYNPAISRVLTFPRGGGFGELRGLRRSIRAEGYGLIADLHDSLRSRFLSIGARHVARVNKRKLARFLLVNFHADLYAQMGGSPSVAERYCEALRPFDVADDGKGLDLFVPPEVSQAANDRLEASGIDMSLPLIALCPGARHGNKMWPPERFADAGARIAAQHRGAVLLLGGPDDAACCRTIEQMIHAASPALGSVSLAGTISLLETAAIMDRCAIVVTNDTGLMHIAAARKRKVVAVFGPTVRQFGFFPFGAQSTVVEHPALDCRPCTAIGLPSCPRGHFKCMREIDAARVVDAAGQLLTHNRN
jgi:lipopolysaccharide heptosyltransferase II